MSLATKDLRKPPIHRFKRLYTLHLLSINSDTTVLHSLRINLHMFGLRTFFFTGCRQKRHSRQENVTMCQI